MTDPNDTTTAGGDQSTDNQCTEQVQTGSAKITARPDGTVWITVDVDDLDQVADRISEVYDVLIPTQRNKRSR